MPASQTKAAIDQTAFTIDFESHAFSAERFFANLRTIGSAPSFYRRGEETYYSFCPADPKLMQRFIDIHTWANARDQDDSIRNSYLNAILGTKPDGDFIHSLG